MIAYVILAAGTQQGCGGGSSDSSGGGIGGSDSSDGGTGGHSKGGSGGQSNGGSAGSANVPAVGSGGTGVNTAGQSGTAGQGGKGGGGGMPQGGQGGSGVVPAPMVPNPIGSGDHTPASVKLVTLPIGNACPGMKRDLAFNPLKAGELWVIAGEALCVITGAPSATPTAKLHTKGADPSHFTASPSGIDFGDADSGKPLVIKYKDGNGVEREERDKGMTEGMPDTVFGLSLDYPGHQGHTLWSSKAYIETVEGSTHYDMLHQSPNAVGIAWAGGRVFWVFGGESGEIVRYDNKTHHGPGGGDHGTASISHWVTGQVKRGPGMSSHLYYQASSGKLFIADTGNKRIAVLDTKSGTRGRDATPHEGKEEDGASAERRRAGLYEHYMQDNATLTTLVPASAGLKEPSGIEVRNDTVYVSDGADGVIYAFDMKGAKTNWLQTGASARSLSGLTFGPDGKIYFVESAGGGRVVRIDP